MRALTVRQPYADAIAHGAKPVENRTKPLPPKYAGVPVLLHAAKDPHVTGITAVDLAQSTDATWCCRPWGQVPTRIQPVVWHWEIDQVILLDQNVPATGALGFWTVPDDVLDQIAHGCHDLPYEHARRILSAIDAKEPTP